MAQIIWFQFMPSNIKAKQLKTNYTRSISFLGVGGKIRFATSYQDDSGMAHGCATGANRILPPTPKNETLRVYL